MTYQELREIQEDKRGALCLAALAWSAVWTAPRHPLGNEDPNAMSGPSSLVAEAWRAVERAAESFTRAKDAAEAAKPGPEGQTAT